MPDIFTKANFLAKSYSYSGSGYGGGLGAGAFLFWMFSWIILYAYVAVTLMFIAKKTATPNTWMAWVPFLNFYLMCKIAGKSIIWFVLLLIPFVNIFATVVLWMAISEKLGKPGWWGILMLVPIANLVIMGILAFSKGPQAAAVSRTSVPTKRAGGKFCPGCGVKAGPGDSFCPECGAKV